MTSDEKYIEMLKPLFPYTAQYVEKYGRDSLVSTYEIPTKYKTTEEFYKMCLAKQKKAREIIKKQPKNAIL